ncbi:MAG: DNA alkylation repair protein [Aeromicrobium sp.]
MATMDALVDAPSIRELGRILRQHGVNAPGVAAAEDAIAGRGLRARVDIVRDAVLADMPHGYDALAAVVRAAFDDAAFSGWMLWPVSEAVADRALDSGRDDDFDDAMDLLALVTTRLSGEFAIRAMLNARLDRTLEIVQKWAASPDMHVRRLASEGTRSHLPWAKGVPELVKRPGRTRPVVDALYTDEHEYVRRSVANHVNDLSRDDPDLAAEIVAGWLSRPDLNTPRVARHALRTTIKAGHPKALELMGFNGSQFDVIGPVIAERKVQPGSDVRFVAHITNTGTQTARIAIDFRLHFRKADGTLRPKVFKIATRTIASGETATIGKSYSFRPQTTRAFHPGEHAIELQINGRPYGRSAFLLTSPEG